MAVMVLLVSSCVPKSKEKLELAGRAPVPMSRRAVLMEVPAAIGAVPKVSLCAMEAEVLAPVMPNSPPLKVRVPPLIGPVRRRVPLPVFVKPWVALSEEAICRRPADTLMEGAVPALL